MDIHDHVHGNLAEAYHLAVEFNADPSAQSMEVLFKAAYDYIYNTPTGADPNDLLNAVIDVALSVIRNRRY